jgi:hypothetical protein
VKQKQTNKTLYKMKTLQIILIAVLTLSSVIAKANDDKKTFEASVVNTKTIQIKTNFVAQVNETYEIQKSYNNKSFTTIATILGSEDAANMPALKINDKITTTSAAVYYRIVMVSTTGNNVVVGTSTVAAN